MTDFLDSAFPFIIAGVFVALALGVIYNRKEK